MRTLDPRKTEAIKNAVYALTEREGLVNLSMSKVAKLAGVSAGTIYIHYRDKEDLLSSMYMEAKVLMDEGLAEDIGAGDLRERMTNAVSHFARRFVEYPSQARFMNAVGNNPSLVHRRAIEFGYRQARVLFSLMNEALESGKLVVEDALSLRALTFGALSDYLRIGGKDVDGFVRLAVGNIMKPEGRRP